MYCTRLLSRSSVSTSTMFGGTRGAGSRATGEDGASATDGVDASVVVGSGAAAGAGEVSVRKRPKPMITLARTASDRAIRRFIAGILRGPYPIGRLPHVDDGAPARSSLLVVFERNPDIVHANAPAYG